MPRASTPSYLALEILPPLNYRGDLKLGRHLIIDYNRIGPPEPGTNYEGTLILRSACAVTTNGFIEPTGELRQA